MQTKLKTLPKKGFKNEFLLLGVFWLELFWLKWLQPLNDCASPRGPDTLRGDTTGCGQRFALQLENGHVGKSGKQNKFGELVGHFHRQSRSVKQGKTKGLLCS